MGERGQTICSGHVPSSGAKLCALLYKSCSLAQIRPPNPNLQIMCPRWNGSNPSSKYVVVGAWTVEK